METKQEPLVRNELKRKITSFSANKDELLKLFKKLEERNYAAGDIEVSNFKQMDQSKEEYEKSKEALKNSFKTQICVAGTDGEQIIGAILEVFNSPNFPDKLKSILVSSDSLFQFNYGIKPRNNFTLFIDFNKPQILDFSFLPSQATPNESNICVTGFDATWVHGVFSEANNFIDRHSSKLTWIHRHSIYDLLLWLLGLPFGFWVVYNLSGFLDKVFGSLSQFIRSAVYVYVFLASLLIFRLAFHYARWVWPLVEYQSPKDKAYKHRITIVTIYIGLIGKLLYDLIKIIF